MKRPAGRSANSYRPSASVVVVRRTWPSAAKPCTCARRSGAPVCAATTRPRMRAVPVGAAPVFGRGMPGTAPVVGAPGRVTGAPPGPVWLNAKEQNSSDNVAVITTERRIMRMLTLNVHDREALLEALDGIASRPRSVLVRDKPRVPGLGNRVGDEAVVQLLRAVDLLTARHTGDVNVADVVEVIAEIADDVAVHDLHVIDVVDDLHAR